MNISGVGILPARKYHKQARCLFHQDAHSTGATQGRFTRPLESAPTIKIIPLLNFMRHFH